MQSSGPDDSQQPLATAPTTEQVDVDPDQFVAAVQPILAQRNPQQLLEFLKKHWTRPQMFALVRGNHRDARKVAALCMTLVGSVRCIPELTQLLADPDPCVNQVAEHALWSIWFRAGSDEANHQLARGAQALSRREFAHAITHFNRAIELTPDFSEAFNQRALAHFLLEDYEASLKDCRETIARMPQHFGAWASLGNNHAHISQFESAIEAYETALSINPHMQTVREAVNELRTKLPQ